MENKTECKQIIDRKKYKIIYDKRYIYGLIHNKYKD